MVDCVVVPWMCRVARRNTIQMHGGMGQKLGNTIHNLGTLAGGLAIGFIHSWKLSLVIISFMPLFALFGGMIKVRHGVHDARTARVGGRALNS